MLFDVNEALFLGTVSRRLELRFEREGAQTFQRIRFEQQTVAASVEFDRRSDVGCHDTRRAQTRDRVTTDRRQTVEAPCHARARFLRTRRRR